MFSKEVLKIVKRLQEARLSLMRKQPFYAVLLLHMQFSLDPMCETAYTDGERIVFCPDFIETLSDEELEFVLMHEVLHAALNHCNRKLDSYDFDDFNTACDIVVNSNILYSFDMDLSKITLTNYGESMHIAPDGKEGYEYTVEEVYRLIQDKHEAEDRKNKKNSSSSDNNKKNKKKEKSDGTAKNDSQEKGNPDDTEDEEEQNREEGDSSEDGIEDEAATPARSDGGFDDHTYWGLDDQDETSGQGGDGEGEGTDSDSDEDDSNSENGSDGSNEEIEGEGKAPKTGHNNSR